MEILRRMPCFTNAEPPSTKMSNFFPFTKWVSVSLGGDPPAFVTARFPLGTPESMVSRIQLLQGSTAQETAEVVCSSRLLPCPRMRVSYIWLDYFLYCLQLVTGVRNLM